MPVFVYEGVGIDAAPCSGQVEALNRHEALHKLLAAKIQPQSLVLAGTIASPTSPVALVDHPETTPSLAGHQGGVSLSTQELIRFTNELADFLDSGLSLESALQVMANAEEETGQREVGRRVLEKVREGLSLSRSLAMSSPTFGILYCSVVAAGEASGSLVALLRRQAQYMQSIEDLMHRLKMALIYPVCLVGAAILALTVFLTYLVPQLRDLLVGTGAELPLSTLILLRLGRFLEVDGVWMLLGMVGVGMVFYVSIRRPEGARRWDEYRLTIPVWGLLWRQGFEAQFCQTLANLLQNGVPLHDALKLLSQSIANRYHREVILKVMSFLGEGLPLTLAMKKAGGFSVTLRDLLKAGEQTGELAGCLDKVGQRYAKLLAQQIEKTMTWLQPVIVVLMGLMVFAIAWSMLSGIFQALHGLQPR